MTSLAAREYERILHTMIVRASRPLAPGLVESPLVAASAPQDVPEPEAEALAPPLPWRAIRTHAVDHWIPNEDTDPRQLRVYYHAFGEPFEIGRFE